MAVLMVVLVVVVECVSTFDPTRVKMEELVDEMSCDRCSCSLGVRDGLSDQSFVFLLNQLPDGAWRLRRVFPFLGVFHDASMLSSIGQWPYLLHPPPSNIAIYNMSFIPEGVYTAELSIKKGIHPHHM